MNSPHLNSPHLNSPLLNSPLSGEHASQQYAWMQSPNMVANSHAYVGAYQVRENAPYLSPAHSLRSKAPVANAAMTSPSKPGTLQPVVTARQYLEQLQSPSSGGVSSSHQSHSYAVEKKTAATDEDEHGHFKVIIGSLIDQCDGFPSGRYRIIKLLGSGTYGKVVKCEDKKYNASVAVKLVRREPHLYRVSAKNEISILRDLDGRFGTLKLLRSFEHHGHICMSFELLGDHLSEVIKTKGPFKIEQVRDIAFQLAQAVSYVHSKKIIHTDLKAENILLMSNPSGAVCVKVADFGSAIYSSAWHPPLVGTMHYRAPEAVLQAGWSYPLDVWAIGCLICEIYTGKYLFELAHDDVHLWMMDRLLGPCPQELLKQGYQNRNQYNASLLQRGGNGNVQLAPCRKEGQEMVRSMQPLREMIHDHVLLDLLQRMFHYNPKSRMTAEKALMHPFFDLEDDEDVPEIRYSHSLQLNFADSLLLTAQSSLMVGATAFFLPLISTFSDEDLEDERHSVLKQAVSSQELRAKLDGPLGKYHIADGNKEGVTWRAITPSESSVASTGALNHGIGGS